MSSLNRHGTAKQSPMVPDGQGGMLDKREVRQRMATARQADRAGRSSREQLARLDAMLGVGVGASRERARLSK